MFLPQRRLVRNTPQRKKAITSDRRTGRMHVAPVNEKMIDSTIPRGDIAHTLSSARVALKELDDVRAQCNATSSRLEKTSDTAQQTLKEIRATLDKWDTMKKRFSDALDSAVHRIADAMRDEGGVAKPVGPPSGTTAHGSLLADANLPNPSLVVECSEVARPKMNAGILAHEYADTPEVLKRKVSRKTTGCRPFIQFTATKDDESDLASPPDDESDPGSSKP